MENNVNDISQPIEQARCFCNSEDFASVVNSVNAQFYAQVAESFSATRKQPWDGWVHLVDGLRESKSTSRVLDVACGNLRFERFLDYVLPLESRHYVCIDSCSDLVSEIPQNVTFVNQDIVINLLNDNFSKDEGNNNFDLTVCFGFFHHVPTFELRVKLLRKLISQTVSQGIIVISLWCFLRDSRLAAKAKGSTTQACVQLDINEDQLQRGDCFMGWQDRSDVFRFSHSFDTDEIAILADSVSETAEIIEIFEADGKQGDLNTYLVLRKR